MAKYFSKSYNNSNIILQQEDILKEKSYIKYLNIFLIFTTISFIREKYKISDENLQNRNNIKEEILTETLIKEEKEGIPLNNSKRIEINNGNVKLKVVKIINEEELSKLLVEFFNELGNRGENAVYIDVKRNSFGIITNIYIKGIKYEDSIQYIKEKISNMVEINLE